MKKWVTLLLFVFISFQSARSQSTAHGPIGMDPAKLQTVARNIFNMSQVMTEKFLVADAIGLSFYIMRYMAEIGEYTLVNKDLTALISAFEKITKKEVSPETKDFLSQVQSVDFGVRRGKFYARVNTFNSSEGAVIPIHKLSTEEDSSVEEIVEVRVKDKSELFFTEISSSDELDELKTFVTKKVFFVWPTAILASALNQVHPDLKKVIGSYVSSAKRPAPPLNIEMKGITVLVKTSTILKDINFEFDRSVFMPGIVIGDNEPVPSLMLSAQSGLLKLKVSVDQ